MFIEEVHWFRYGRHWQSKLVLIINHFKKRAKCSSGCQSRAVRYFENSNRVKPRCFVVHHVSEVRKDPMSELAFFYLFLNVDFNVAELTMKIVKFAIVCLCTWRYNIDFKCNYSRKFPQHMSIADWNIAGSPWIQNGESFVTERHREVNSTKYMTEVLFTLADTRKLVLP